MIAHVVASSAVALIAVIATFFLRGQRAAWRHAILFAALLRFALPTAWLTEAGARMLRVAPAQVRMSGIAWMLRGPWQTSEPIMGSSGKLHSGPVKYVWYAGIAVCFTIWARRALRSVPALRAASDVETSVFHRVADGAKAELRIVAGDLAPGAWGCWRPAVLLPHGLTAELSAAELEAVLAHEIAHIRRRDNLTAALAHAIVSVFWFHPLVWWIERRMLAERETACDELVLAQGAAARDYAAGILKACRMSFAGASGYAGVNGSNLEVRMEQIMSLDLNRTSSRAARALLGVAMTAATLAPVAGGYLQAQQQHVEERIKPALDLMPEVESLIKEGRGEEAVRLLQSRVAQAPKRLDFRMALGNTAVRAGKYDLAITTFEGVLAQLDNGSTDARGDLYLRIGESYRRKGDIESAITALRQSKELMPDNVVPTATLALVLDAAGRSDEAEREYRTALTIDPENGVAMNNLAFLLSHSRDRLDEALDLALQAQQILHMDEARDTLGWIYLKKNSSDKAIVVFQELTKTQPQHSTYHYHLGMAYAQKGDKAAAIEQLKGALACSPNEKEAHDIQNLLQTLQVP